MGGTGQKYGVSDNAIRKWLKNDNIDPPKIRPRKVKPTLAITKKTSNKIVPMTTKKIDTVG